MNRLRAVSWNVADNGRTPSIRRQAHDMLADTKPHVVFRQELPGAHLSGMRGLHEEANRLGLIAFMCLPQPGRSQRPVGVMVDPALFEVLAHEERGQGWKPICIITARIRGTRRELNLASGHLCHNDPTTRATEARGLTDLADHRQSALVGLDTNSYPVPTPLEEPLPDLHNIADPVHFEHRTIWRGGHRVPDTVPDEILTGAHRGGRSDVPGPFIDLARHAAYNLNPPQPEALAPTASLTRTDQGPPQRVDRIYSTPDLTPALARVTVRTGTAVSAVTDHGMVIADFDLDVLCRAHI